MASIQKRGDTYCITVSNGIDCNGKGSVTQQRISQI